MQITLKFAVNLNDRQVSLMTITLRVVSIALLAAALALPSLRASAQEYPSRPVRLIVPLGAGGPTDLVGRWLAQALGEQLKQSFFVENRPGAAGLIGTVEAAKSAPDGYTLLVVASPHINLEILQPNKPYQLFRDFVAVAPAFSYDALMVVHPSIPAKTVKEFIALAKSQPGKLTYASSGPGSNKHMGGELFKLMTGTDMLHVAYKGSTGARNDIIGGHVNMMFDEIPAVGPNVIAGQVRALGTTGAKARAGLPRRADRLRGRRAGLRAHRLVRHHGAGGHAESDRRSAQRRDQEAARQARDEGDLGQAGRRDDVHDARRLRRLSARRPGEMDQGGEAGGHQAGVRLPRTPLIPAQAGIQSQ